MVVVHPPGPKTVAIVGAGLTGLLAAHGLQQNGFNAVVFEREVSLDERLRDWTMLVHWATPIFEKLVPKDILADLHKAVCNPYLDFDEQVESLPCYNGVTGDLLFRSPTPGARRVSRQALRRLLARRLDIRWNKTMTAVSSTENGVRVSFEGEEKFDADFLLGADGSSSKVRELLLGFETARPRPSGFLFATGITKYADARKTNAIVEAHPVASLMMGTGSVGAVGVMSISDPEDASTWTTFWTKIWRAESVKLSGQEALEYIENNTSPLRDVFQSAIDWTPRDSSVHIDEMKYWIPTPWDNPGGRVTLAGDAAHPMLIYRGQGFQHSITDVNNYVETLTRLESLGDNVALRGEALMNYDAEMIDRGSKAVQQSLEEAEKSLDPEKIKHMLMATKGHVRSA
ncbi:hypothetical protein C2857_005650 [Epichloe festucae Fl1]|uniref:FAD-binding domain-containing protein n=1 Tax=Epichloe festucae (strain Fl1) TaxID=877507 RepID=A0A7S9KL68_EPIFF|nr:hypothetical protein C2857_005650 [Epichloe festucae Fl1]